MFTDLIPWGPWAVVVGVVVAVLVVGAGIVALVRHINERASKARYDQYRAATEAARRRRSEDNP